MKIISLSLLAISLSLALAGCGGSSDSSDTQTTPVTDSSPNTGGDTNSGGDTNVDNSSPVSETKTSEVTTDVGTLKVTNISLPGGKFNAREEHALPHYIGRTAPEANKENILVPIRSYYASCATDTDSPRLFASLSLADANEVGSQGYGSVFEMQYDKDSGRFVATANSRVLAQCEQSHGIAVSQDCSRVAVLCLKAHQSSESETVEKDLIAEHGSSWMQMENNHDKIENRIENDLPRMVATNQRSLPPFLDAHADISIDTYIDHLVNNLGASADAKFSSLNTDQMAYVLPLLPDDVMTQFKQHIREKTYKESKQMWLLEWEQQSLSDEPKAYVVNKLVGGQMGSTELQMVESDSQGRSSYGFSIVNRVFDGNGGPHYSAGLYVVNRDDWSLNMSGSDNRGWYWDCGAGHVLNIRSFYSPHTELYGAICSSDWNNTVAKKHGQLGTIGIKMEGSSSSYTGRSIHLVPSDATATVAGGGHKVLPLNENTNLALIVAPKLIEDADMQRFVTDYIGTTTDSDTLQQDCADFDGDNNCFWAYLFHDYYEESGEYPSISLQGLRSGDVMDKTAISRIGLAKIDATNGSIEGQAFKWIVSDDDCSLSDPQMVDLQNGRYLLGYAKFQCVSDGEKLDRYNGPLTMLPKAYYIAEIDSEGNILSGPTSIGNHGWGGVDDIVPLGQGKAGWGYMPNPLIDGHGGPQQQEWEIMVYQSESSQ